MRTHDPHAHAGLCAVQEFSWTEDGLLQAKRERGESLEPEAAAALAKEPMFCFEVCASICCLLPHSDRLRSITMPLCAVVCRRHVSRCSTGRSSCTPMKRCATHLLVDFLNSTCRASFP